ncbi:MAG: hypothetical protein COA97_03590 [Flavobacteriales bacterium]|nr:MAG: hypothetical protein COA97_03590 [Flavobacteriales bacterium]
MKTLLLILSFAIFGYSCGQTRKHILKEISHYKHQICKNTSYQTSAKEIKKLSTTFFSNYYAIKEDSISVTFLMTKNLSFFKEYRDLKRHYVYVNVLTKDNQKIITIEDRTEDYDLPFADVEFSRSKGSFKLDRKGFYNYLYQNLCGNNIEISAELDDKINSYNSKQTQERKKIINGRDY